jgi:hypothetical protein
VKHNKLLTLFIVFVMAASFVTPALAEANVNSELSQVRNATARYHNLQFAMASDYNLVPGLDYCFADPGVGGMGYHYINTALMDTTVDPLNPEALVYAPTNNGGYRLVAVEYIVPAAVWDADHSQPPVLFGQTFELNNALGVYTLHAWIWQHNSLGMFSDWNPNVSCN